MPRHKTCFFGILHRGLLYHVHSAVAHIGSLGSQYAHPKLIKAMETCLQTMSPLACPGRQLLMELYQGHRSQLEALLHGNAAPNLHQGSTQQGSTVEDSCCLSLLGSHWCPGSSGSSVLVVLMTLGQEFQKWLFLTDPCKPFCDSNYMPE